MAITDKDVLMRYERRDQLLRFTLTNTTNHEMRELMVGLFCRLAPADREDHIRELVVYATDPESWLSPVAGAIKHAGEGESEIDLAALVKRGEKIRP